MAKKKAEIWSKDFLPHYEENEISYFDELHGRELLIVSCAILDLALDEMIRKRFVDDHEIIEQFMSFDNGSISSFSSKIKCAYLLGILRKEEYATLNELRKLRNEFAHKVNVDFNSQEVNTIMSKIIDQSKMKRNMPAKLFEEWKIQICSNQTNCEAIIKSIVQTYQFSFSKKIATIKRIKISTKYYSGEMEI